MTDGERADFRAGFVAVVGRPNVGKSTLINALLGQKIAAVSPRPQTTRRLQLGILTLENAQVVFIDTPGLHQPVHKLGEYMNAIAAGTLKEADLVLWLVDAAVMPNQEDRIAATRMAEIGSETPILLALNKVDLVSGKALDAHQAAYLALLPGALPLRVSALNAYQLDRLVQMMVEMLPAGEAFYSPEQVTDLYEREIAAELIREAALLHLRDEVPHSLAVRMDEFQERGETGALIRATLLVERDSQKGIVIGKNGTMLKAIGSTARQEIERMSGRKVFLDLRVKVNQNWRNDPFVLKLLGYATNPKKK